MDEYKKIFNKFYRKIAAEGFIKSLLFGAIAGFGINAVMALVFYLLGMTQVWIAIVCGAAVLVGLTAALYFGKYRPTEQTVAARVDMLGLKERLITMVGAQDDSSYMAVCQRRDAAVQLQRVKNTTLKMQIGILSIILSAVVFILSFSTTTVCALSATGEIPSFEEIITPEDAIPSYEITYMEEDGGHIEGDLFQIVQRGGDCNEVLAVADDGYVFNVWSDGVTTPSRTDTNITQSMTVVATFIKVDDASSDDEKSDEVGDIDIDEETGMMNPNGGAAGKYEEYNQVIDGETYYRDVYQQYYEEAMRILSEGGVVPEYIRLIVQEYFDVIL